MILIFPGDDGPQLGKSDPERMKKIMPEDSATAKARRLRVIKYCIGCLNQNPDSTERNCRLFTPNEQELRLNNCDQRVEARP